MDQDQQVDLIDAPGFNDTIRSGTEILSEIVDFLQSKHRIAGVIHLHPIQERRLTGTSRLNLNLLQSICGEHFYSHVTVVTIMWNALPDGSPTIDAQQREQAFKEGDEHVVWKDMLDKGSGYARHTGVDESSRAIVRSLLSKHQAPPLNLSLELRDPTCTLEDTSASLILTADAKAHEERLRWELEEEEEEARELQAKLEKTRQRATQC